MDFFMESMSLTTEKTIVCPKKPRTLYLIVLQKMKTLF